MNNDYNSSKGLPIGKRNPTGLLSVLIKFMPYYRHALIQFSIIFLMGFSIANVGYSQVTINDSYGPLCNNGTEISLSGSPSPGTWTSTLAGFTDASNTDATTRFNPNGVAPGTYTFTYTLSTGASASTNITVNAAPTATVTTPIPNGSSLGTICENATGLNLTGTIIGTNEMGEWSGMGITDDSSLDPNAIFDPSGLSGMVPLTYTFTNANGCKDKIDVNITIYSASINPPAKTVFCESDAVIALTGSPDPSSIPNSTGSWSGSGINDANTNDATANFDPSGLSGNITLTYTFSDDAGCTDAATVIVTVNPLPVVVAGDYGPLCKMDDPITLSLATPFPQSNETGTWSGTGLTDINPSLGNAKFNPVDASIAAGTHTLTYTFEDNNGCANTASTNIIVNNNPSITVTLPTDGMTTNTDRTFCQDGPVVNLSATAPANPGNTGVWSGSGVTDVSSFDGVATFSPSGLDEIIPLTYTLNDGCESSETFEIEVVPLPVVSVLGDATLAVCEGSTALTFTGNPLPQGSSTSGDWSSNNNTAGLLTSNTGGMVTFNPSVLMGPFPKTIILTYTYQAANGCANTATKTITVNGKPTANAVGNQTLCTGENTTSINFLGAPSAGVVYNWTNSNTDIGLAASGSGNISSFVATNNSEIPITATITVTPIASDCTGNPITFDIVVNPTPVITLGTITNPDNCGALNGNVLIEGMFPNTTFTLNYLKDGVSATPNTSFVSDAAGIAMITGLGAGTYTQITVTTAATANCISNELSFDLIDPDAPVVNQPDNQSLCSGSATDLVTFTGTSGAEFTWTSNPTLPGTSPVVNELSSRTLTNNTALDIVYEITVTPTKNNCTGSPQTFNITVRPAVGAGTFGAVCEDATNILLTGKPDLRSNETGVWSGSGSGITNINSTTGTAEFDPSNLEGLITLTYTFTTTSNCPNSVTTTIMVNPLPTSTAMASQTKVCEDTPVDLVLTGSPVPMSNDGSSGTWTGAGVTDGNIGDATANFDPSGLTGDVTLTYTFTNGNGCTNMANTTVQVFAPPVAATGTYSPVCQDADSVMLIGTPIPMLGQTGKWSGNGIRDENIGDATAKFGPEGLIGAVTLTYTFTNENGCSDVETTSIMVNPLPNVNAGTYTAICENAMPITLSGLPNVSGGATGKWTGPGVTDATETDNTAQFNPNGLSGTVNLTYEFTNAAGCSESSTTTVQIIAPPTVEAGNYDPVCENGGLITLDKASPLPANGETGTWSGGNFIQNVNPNSGIAQFNPIGLEGDFILTYTYKNAAGCEVATNTTITVKQPDAGTYGPFCSNNGIITLTGSPIPGPTETGKWEVVSGIGQTANTVIDQSDKDAVASFDPTGLTGAIVLKYVFTDVNGCTDEDMVTISVNALPTPTLLTYQDVCIDGGLVDLAGAPVPSGNLTGVWSGIGVINANGSLGTANFNPTVAGVGTHTLTYTFTDLNNCSNEMSSTGATTTITVNALPSLTTNGSTTICLNNGGYLSGSPAPNHGDPNNYPNTYGGTSNWTGPGVINVNESEGFAEIDPIVAGVGTHTYTYTYEDGNGCMETITTQVTIDPLPVVNAGNDTTICANTTSIDLLGSPVPSSGQNGYWYGPNVTDVDPNDAAATFDPTNLSTGDYIVTYVFDDGNGCSTSAEATIKVIVPPTVSITSNVNLPAELCEENMPINLNGFPVPNGTTEQGNWTGTGITPSGNKDGKATFNPSGLKGIYTLKYTFLDDTGCESYAETMIEVIDLALTMPQQGPACITPNTPIMLADSSTAGVTTGVWSGIGVNLAGNMFDPSLVSTSSVDLTYQLTHTSSGCSTEATTTIDITEPIILLASIDSICANEEITLIGHPIPSGMAKGIWSGTGVSNMNDADGTATFNLNTITASTEETLTYTYTDENGCQNSGTVEVFVHALPTTPTLAPTNNICKNAGHQIITAIPAVTGTGVWTSDNGGIISQTNTTVTFDPSGYEDGATITLTYDFTDKNSCVAASAPQVITITEIIPTASADVAIVCPAGADVTLTGTPTANGTGVWTLPNDTPLSTTNGVAMFDPTGFIGDVVLTYTFTETNGANCVVSATTTVNVTATAITLPDYGNICQSAAPIRVVGNPVPKVDESGVWSAVGFNTSVLDPSDVDGAALFDPSKLPNGTSFPTTVELVYTFTDKQGCASSDTTEIVVYSMPIVTISSPVTQLCAQADPIMVTGFPLPSTSNNSIGKWTGDGITDNNDGTAVFNPTGLSNQVTLTYTYTDDLACTQSEDVVITILDDEFTITPIPAVCINATGLDLSSTIMPAGGTWSGLGVTNNVFDATAAGYGTHTLTYSLTNGNGCSSSTTTTVTVVEPTITVMNTACSNDGPITLTGSVSNGGTGTWAIIGATNTTIPTTNGIASLDPTGLSGTISLTYTFDLNGCQDIIATQIVIQAPPTANAGAAIDVCLGTGSIIITGSTIPTGGSSQWTGDGITDANTNDVFAVFNPANLDGPITVTYEITDATGCTTQDTKVITVKNLEVSAGTYGAVCESSDSITLTGTPAGGTWVGFGVSDKGNGTATFGSKGKNGNITVSYVFTDGVCSETASTTITVFDAQISAGTYGPFCQNDAPITVTGFPIPSGGAIGTWSGTGLTNIDPNNGTATLNPASVTGNTTLTYNFITNGCSKSVTTNVAVNQSSTASITIDQAQICEGSSVQLTASTTNAAGITWATSGIGSFSPTTGNSTTYTPSGTVARTNRIDEISVVAVASTGNCPVAVASTDLRIIKPATVSLGQDISFCDVNMGTLTSATFGIGNTISWSATDGIFDNNTATNPIYTANSLTTSSRTDVLTITARDSFNACPVATDIMNVRLTNPIKITAGTTGAICESDTIILTANYTTSMGGFTSQINGNKGNVIIHGGAIKYVPNPNDGLTIRKDTVILINLDLDGLGACLTFRDTMIVDVSPMATVHLIADTTICLGEQIDLIDVTTGNFVNFSSSANLSTSISSYPANTTTLTGTSILDTVIYSTQLASSICPAAVDSVVITINTLSTIALNFEDTTICAANVLAIATDVSTAIYNWEVIGNAGILNDSTLSNPTYTPTIDSLMTTRIDTLVLNLVDSTDRCKTGLDSMVITIDPTAIVNLIADTTICIGEQLNLVSLITGDSVRFASSANLSTSALNYPNSTTITIPEAAIIDTVLYSTQLAGSSCPAVVDSTTITINNLSTISSTILDTTICEGSTVTLMADSGAVVYNWEIVGNAGTLNDSTSYNPTYTPDTSTFVTARMDTLILHLVDSTDRCKTGIDTVIITILEMGTFSPIPDTTICTNNTLALDVPTTGIVHQFNWTSSNGSFSSATDTNTVYTPSAITSGSGLDTLLTTIQFASSACPIVTDTTIITVLAGAVANAGMDATVCENIPLQLAGIVTGSATSGTWQVVGGFGIFSDSSALNALYTPNTVGNVDRVDVLVLTTNDPDSTGACTAATDTVLVTVTPGATVDLGQDLTMFNGQSIILTANASEAVISSQWTSAPGSLSNSGLNQTVFTPLTLGTESSRIDQIIYQGFFTNQNCGSAIDTINVTVNAPQAISKSLNNDFCGSLCLDEVTVSIDANTGTAVVLANNINPLDTCAVNTQFDFKFWNPTMLMAEPNTVIDVPNLPSTITFNCNDRGQQAVNVYVSDATMNTQLCPVIINVKDNNIFCGERTITGSITNSAGGPAVGFDVFVEEVSEIGGVAPSVKTDATGAYSITLTADKQYKITPRRTIDVADGVTAFDNVIISRHILGLQPFVSPYQTIAADVNKSGSVTAFDIVLIRKIVLSKDAGFDNNTSWRFIDANYQFPNIMDAASAPFQESFLVTQTTGNVEDMNFIAVKIGDVNNTNSSNAGLVANAESRNDANPLVFETANLLIEKGEIYEVPFKLSTTTKVASYQFTLDFTNLELLDIQSGVATPAHFQIGLKERGLLTTCWSTPTPVLAKDNWFTLRFKATENGQLSELLNINSEITPIEAYTSEAANIGIQLRFTAASPTTFDLFQNRPNPFNNQTIIGFALPQATPAKITVLDVQGKVINTIEGNYDSGYNETIIDMTNLPRGVFYYRLETAFGTKTQKMMHIE